MLGKIHINDNLPDGTLFGFDADAHVIVVVEFYPNYGYVFGNSDDMDVVVEWNVCAAHARRIAMTASWAATGHHCQGSA